MYVFLSTLYKKDMYRSIRIAALGQAYRPSNKKESDLDVVSYPKLL